MDEILRQEKRLKCPKRLNFGMEVALLRAVKHWFHTIMSMSFIEFIQDKTVEAALLTGVLGAVTTYYVAHVKIKKEHMSEQEKIIRSYQYPLLAATIEAEHRLKLVLEAVHTDWLAAPLLNAIRNQEGFAKDPGADGYFACSTIYHIAAMLCWREVITKKIGYIYKPCSKSAVEYETIQRTLTALFRIRKPWDGCPSVDAIIAANKNIKDEWKLYEQFQHSVGEAMIVEASGVIGCMSFKQFFEKYKAESHFRFWMLPIERYFVDLCNLKKNALVENVATSGDLRILRLIALRYWLAKLGVLLANKLNRTYSIVLEDIIADLPQDVAERIRTFDKKTKETSVG